MDIPAVEPFDGPELDRLITAMLNLTGVVKSIIESAPAMADDPPDGLVVIGQAAEQSRRLLAPVVEHYDDAELAYIREFLAISAVVMADGIGEGHVFRGPPQA